MNVNLYKPHSVKRLANLLEKTDTHTVGYRANGSAMQMEV